MNPKVNFYFKKAKKFQEELELLRTVVLDTGLTEELKWGVPCYTFDGHNIVLIHVFKEYCAVLFVKGSLLKDTEKVLVQQTKNVQAGRQLRFTSVKEITASKKLLKAYVKEAVTNEKAGLKVQMKDVEEYDVPEEFDKALRGMPALKRAFNALTPGRQRGYLLYFSSAKQPKTREARIEKYMEQILEGKGLED
jgi:uncharacterized protein YdeI (YjbR/CyaY-like superfamily)